MKERGLDPVPFGEPVKLAIRYEQRKPTSMVSMLKATIDGLEPLLGRSPTANPRARFFPADERVEEVVAVRAGGDEDRASLGWNLR